MRTALAALALVVAVGPAAAADVYLFDLLHRPDYKRAYTAMLKSSPSVPKWVTAYSRTLNGSSQPAKEIKADGGTYLLADVCKVHVIFAPGGQRAWGRLYENGSASWIGSLRPRSGRRPSGLNSKASACSAARTRRELRAGELLPGNGRAHP
ncbi:Ivy family c-type lysozyme inhibitor [Heyndrickxia sporothermodurans]